MPIFDFLVLVRKWVQWFDWLTTTPCIVIICDVLLGLTVRYKEEGLEVDCPFPLLLLQHYFLYYIGSWRCPPYFLWSPWALVPCPTGSSFRSPSQVLWYVDNDKIAKHFLKKQKQENRPRGFWVVCVPLQGHVSRLEGERCHCCLVFEFCLFLDSVFFFFFLSPPPRLFPPFLSCLLLFHHLLYHLPFSIFSIPFYCSFSPSIPLFLYPVGLPRLTLSTSTAAPLSRSSACS